MWGCALWLSSLGFVFEVWVLECLSSRFGVRGPGSWVLASGWQYVELFTLFCSCTGSLAADYCYANVSSPHKQSGWIQTTFAGLHDNAL